MTDELKPQTAAEYTLFQAAARLRARAAKYPLSMNARLLIEIADDLEGRTALNTVPVRTDDELERLRNERAPREVIEKLNKAIGRAGQAGVSLGISFAEALDQLIAQRDAAITEFAKYKQLVVEHIRFGMAAVITDTPENQITAECDALRVQRDALKAALERALPVYQAAILYNQQGRPAHQSGLGIGQCSCAHCLLSAAVDTALSRERK